ncbi:MAG: carboxypeptidase regulatory-like domain-containing protein [candidate division Zixibacteria bacterium]|nr:carboxypeptidase regulatory-like domain-containing protein [candidate division Zixibacteria bacterium]
MPLSTGHAATFGAVEGAVHDRQSGSPLVGAVVSISRPGHLTEAVTDSLGDYRVGNLIAGRYRLVIAAIGYDSLVVDELHVVAGVTTVQPGRLALVGEASSGVSTTTQNAVGAAMVARDEITRLPARTLQDFLLLQPTVTESRSNAIQLHEIQAAHDPQNSTQVHAMGGRLWDEGYAVNGVSFTEPISRNYTASVSPHAIEQLVFRSSLNSATASDGNSGAIEILTRGGGEQYSGMVEAVTDNGIGSGYDQNWYTARLSGPIPLLKRGYFMSTVERRWLADRNPSPKTKEVLPGAPDRLPNNWQSGWTYHGRADYDFTDDLSLTVTGDKSSDEWSEYRHVFLFDIAHTPRFKDDNLGLSGRLACRINDKVSASIVGNYRETERIQGDGVVFDNYEAYRRHYVWPDGWVTDIGNPELDGFDLFYVSDELTRATDTSGNEVYMPYDHYFANFMHYKSSTLGFQSELSARLGDHNILSAGFEYRRHTLRYFENLDATNSNSDRYLIRYGYDSLGRESDSEDWRHDTKHPVSFAFFAQDRLSYMGFALTAGLRWEKFDHKDYLLRSYTNPFGLGDPEKIDQVDLTKTSSFGKLSPSFRASYRVRDLLRVHAGFAISHQLPPLRQIYNDWALFENRVTSARFHPHSDARIETVKSSNLDVGLAIRASDQLTFSFAAFWRKTTDEIGIASVDSVAGTISSYVIYAGGLETKAKGFTAGVESRLTSLLRTSLTYTWTEPTGVPQIGLSSFGINWSAVQLASSALNYDRRHKFVGGVDLNMAESTGPRIGGIYPLQGLNVNLTARVSSGRPYTPLAPYDGASERLHRRVLLGSVNSERSEWVSTVDLRVQRRVSFGGMSFVPFLWIKNLLDTENIADVWNVTGEPDYNGYLDTEMGQIMIEYQPDPDETGLNYEQKYMLKQANPQNYGPPRQVFFGIRAEF